MTVATKPRRAPAQPVRAAAAPPHDDRAFSIPWRRIALSILALFAVAAAWFVTTNTYAVLAQQGLADRWAGVLAAGAPLESSAPGDLVARISIPSLGIERVVVEGSDRGTLRRGPGHQPGTAMPGQLGNSVIRGHRLLWSGPFRQIDQLGFGAPIHVQLADGSVLTFLVAGIFHLDPANPDIVSGEGDRPMITFVTSDPPFRADRVLVVKAVLPGDGTSP